VVDNATAGGLGKAKGARAIPKQMKTILGAAGNGPTPKSWTNGAGTFIGPDAGGADIWPAFRDAAWGTTPVGTGAGAGTQPTGWTCTWRGYDAAQPVGEEGIFPKDSGLMDDIGLMQSDHLDYGYPATGGAPVSFELRYRVDVTFTPRAYLWRNKDFPAGYGPSKNWWFDEYIPLPPEWACTVKLLSNPKHAPNTGMGAFDTFSANNFAAINFADPAIQSATIAGLSSQHPSPWGYDAGCGLGEQPLKLAIFVNAGVAGANCYVEAVDGANQADAANTSEGQGQATLAPISCVQGDQVWITQTEVSTPAPLADGVNPQGYMRFEQASPAPTWHEGEFFICGTQFKDAAYQFTDIGYKARVTSQYQMWSDSSVYKFGDSGSYLPPTGMTGEVDLEIQTATGNVGRKVSTKKIKKNIVDSTVGLSELMNLRSVQFEMRKTPGDIRLGLIAEELAEVNPQLVSWGPDSAFSENGEELMNEDGSVKLLSNNLAPLAPSSSAMLSLLVKSIQELKEENDQLKLRIEALEAE